MIISTQYAKAEPAGKHGPQQHLKSVKNNKERLAMLKNHVWLLPWGLHGIVCIQACDDDICEDYASTEMPEYPPPHEHLEETRRLFENHASASSVRHNACGFGSKWLRPQIQYLICNSVLMAIWPYSLRAS